MSEEIIESCLNCKRCDRKLLSEGKTFCVLYPIKMSLLNKDIIGGYICEEYGMAEMGSINNMFKDFVAKHPIRRFDIPKSIPDMDGGGIRVMGMFPIDEEFVKKLKKHLKKMGFKF